jgi:hypothetical protein
MANRSDLSIRIAAILDGTQPRGRVRFLPAAMALVAAVATAFVVAPVRAVGVDRVEAAGQAARGGQRRGALTLDRRLFDAAEEGNLDDIASLLAAGADINAVLYGDGSPLIMAAREGHIDVVDLLVNRGARVDQVAPDDENALIQASARGRLTDSWTSTERRDV